MAKDNTYKKENALLVLAKRMSRNKNAMFGLTLFVILVLAIIIVPIVSPYQYDKMDVMTINGDQLLGITYFIILLAVLHPIASAASRY